MSNEVVDSEINKDNMILEKLMMDVVHIEHTVTIMYHDITKTCLDLAEKCDDINTVHTIIKIGKKYSDMASNHIYNAKRAAELVKF